MSIYTYNGIMVCMLLVCMSQPLFCLTLCNPMHWNPPGSSVYGLLQARILEWVAIPFSRGSSRPREKTQIDCILQADSLPSEPPGKPLKFVYIPFFWISFSFRSPQSVEESSLCCAVGSHQLSISLFFLSNIFCHICNTCHF